MPAKVNLAAKFAAMADAWVPTVVGELNGQYVKVVRFEGEYVWHHHDHEDEMFLVIDGTMRMCLRDGDVTVEPGEFIVIPRGVEHKPVGEPVCRVVLFEPATTRNTGNVDHAYTIEPGDLPRA